MIISVKLIEDPDILLDLSDNNMI